MCICDSIRKYGFHEKTSRHHSFSPSVWIATILRMDQDMPILLLVSEPQPNRTEGSREIIEQSTIYSTFLWDWSPGLSACAGIPLPSRLNLLCEVLICDPQCASAQRKRFRNRIFSVSGGFKSSFLQISKIACSRKTCRQLSFSPSA